MNMTLRFRDFWVGFQENENLFLDILTGCGFNVSVVRDKGVMVDLEIVSVFPPPRNPVIRILDKVYIRLPDQLKKALNDLSQNLKGAEKQLYSRKVFYTGENLRAPLDDSLSGSLSFDQQNFGKFNAYCPVWYLDLDFFHSRHSTRLGTRIKMTELLMPRVLDLNHKTDFMCAFLNNPEPTRIRAIREFTKLNKVDVFGSYSGNKVVSKLDVATKYRFILCFENDLYPGYVTEKPLEAYMAGAVPVYWGDLGIDQSINRKALINFKDFSSIEDFVSYISKLSLDEYQEIYEQPFLLQIPDISSITQILCPDV
jgi:hypothetical protein